MILLCVAILTVSFCRQILFYNSLSESTKIDLLFMVEMRDLLINKRRINNQSYTCVIPVAENLQLKNDILKPINLTSQSNQLRKKIEKRLSVLQGLCVLHETDIFLWEYCHRHSIRQFDNYKTANNILYPAKKYYEDIMLGYFNKKQYSTKTLNIQKINKIRQKNKFFQVNNIQSQQPQPTLLKNIRITSIKKFYSQIIITSQMKILEDRFYHVIKIPQNGILKLHCLAKDYNITYYLTKQYPLQYKIISKDGQFEAFESTFYRKKQLQDSFLIHIIYSQNSNQKMFGIWKQNDFVNLPRFFSQQEKPLYYQIINGNATISFAKIQDMQKIIKQYLFVQQKQNYQEANAQQSNQLHNNSFLIESLYKQGDYCGQPINKFRQTTVVQKCGPSLFKIEEIKEIDLCVYRIVVSTQMLCQKKTFPQPIQMKYDQSMICLKNKDWNNLTIRIT